MKHEAKGSEHEEGSAVSNGIDSIVDWFRITQGNLIKEHYDSLIEGGMSPIEAMFEAAFLTLAMLRHPHLPATAQAYVLASMDGVPKVIPPNYIMVVPQARVLDWPVDFLICVGDHGGRQHRAVVECDGHDYHERTKEQAARDRSRDRRLQDAGVRVFRFTGSELFRSPFQAAIEVRSWANKIWGHVAQVPEGP